MSDTPKYVTVTYKPKGGSIRCGNQVFYGGRPTRVHASWLEKWGGPMFHVDYSEFSDHLVATNAEGAPVVDFWAPLSAVDGYGRHALDIWRGMKNLGVECRLRNAGYFIDRPSLPMDVLSDHQRHQDSLPAKVGIAMSVPYDPQIWEHQSVTRIVITQFETDHIPERHIESVNRCDHFITTGSFQVPIWKKGGVNIPIDHLTPGVDTDFFTEVEHEPGDKFRILMLGALTPRKNPLGAIRAFQQASKASRDWELTIKTRKAAKYTEIIEEAKKDSRIKVIVGDSSPEQILNLYHTNDCFLWPSKGEGVGLPPLEAMSCGLEVVCAFNSGMRDYVGADWCWPIKTEGMEYAGPPLGFSAEYVNTYGDVGQWWVPSEDHCAKQLGKAFDAWAAGHGKGHAAAEYVRANHTLGHQAESVLRVVRKYL